MHLHGVEEAGEGGLVQVVLVFFPFSSRPENSLFHIDYRMDTDQYLNGWTGLKKIV